MQHETERDRIDVNSHVCMCSWDALAHGHEERWQLKSVTRVVHTSQSFCEALPVWQCSLVDFSLAANFNYSQRLCLFLIFISSFESYSPFATTTVFFMIELMVTFRNLCFFLPKNRTVFLKTCKEKMLYTRRRYDI